MPLQERLWAENRGKAPQSIPPELLRFGGQPAALVVGESWLFAQLFPEDLDLLLEVFDDKLLVTVEPTGQADKHELQSVHRPILPNRFCSDESRLAAPLPCPPAGHPQVSGPYGIVAASYRY